MKITILIVVLFPKIILAETAFSRQGMTFDSESTRSRLTVTAVRVSNPVVIDGMLAEAEWQRPGITDFTQRDPAEGASPTERTEVWVAYDDEALYIAARMYDSHPDSIVFRIGRRDADVNSDWFYIAVDSYHDRRNAFFFAVNPGGSVQDGTFYNDDWSDNSWDGVWETATRVDPQGWTAEMRIPYSQLRFHKLDEYVWGINFMRSINRKDEEDWFVMVPKKESGTVSRFADLVGIRDINPPARVEILPYAVSSSTFTNRYDAADLFHSSKSLSGNMERM